MEARGLAFEWRPFVGSNPEILVGKPAVLGTRLAVEFILGLFAAGWSEQQVLDNYPQLSRDSLRAVFAYAAEFLRKETSTAAPAK